jgi:hypothetical protein
VTARWGRWPGPWSPVGLVAGGVVGYRRNCIELGPQKAPALSPCPLWPISGAIIRFYEASNKCQAANPHWPLNGGPFRHAGAACRTRLFTGVIGVEERAEKPSWRGLDARRRDRAPQNSPAKA